MPDPFRQASIRLAPTSQQNRTANKQQTHRCRFRSCNDPVAKVGLYTCVVTSRHSTINTCITTKTRNPCLSKVGLHAGEITGGYKPVTVGVTREQRSECTVKTYLLDQEVPFVRGGVRSRLAGIITSPEAKGRNTTTRSVKRHLMGGDVWGVGRPGIKLDPVAGNCKGPRPTIDRCVSSEAEVGSGYEIAATGNIGRVN